MKKLKIQSLVTERSNEILNSLSQNTEGLRLNNVEHHISKDQPWNNSQMIGMNSAIR